MGRYHHLHSNHNGKMGFICGTGFELALGLTQSQSWSHSRFPFVYRALYNAALYIIVTESVGGVYFHEYLKHKPPETRPCS